MTQHGLRLLVLGDSVSVGNGFSGVTSETCYATRLGQELASANVTVEVTTSAIEGIDTGYALKRFPRMVTALDPDHAIVMLGLNDACPPGKRPPITPAEYRQNLLGIVDRMLSLDIRPWLVASNPRRDDTADSQVLAAPCRPSWEMMRPYADVVVDIAHQFHLTSLNLFERFLALGNLHERIPDGIHPDPLGHAWIAAWLAELLVPFFGGTPRPMLVDPRRELEVSSLSLS